MLYRSQSPRECLSDFASRGNAFRICGALSPPSLYPSAIRGATRNACPCQRTQSRDCSSFLVLVRCRAGPAPQEGGSGRPRIFGRAVAIIPASGRKRRGGSRRSTRCPVERFLPVVGQRSARRRSQGLDGADARVRTTQGERGGRWMEKE